MIRGLLLGLALLTSSGIWAQEAQRSPVLTLNQERLYLSSEFGERVRAKLEQDSAALAAENRRIESALIDEERRLTEDRKTLEPEEFRALADDFDERVTGIRRAQEQKRNAIQSEAEAERARFFELAYPLLVKLVEETGAVAILNQSAIIISARQIDVTDLAIDQINTEIGAAPPPPDPGVTPTQRPDVPEPTDN